MAFSEIEKDGYEKLVAKYIEQRRPAKEIRDKIDLAYRIGGQDIIILEIRPYIFDRTRKIETEIAKATFVRKKNIWKVYWMPSDLKWHSYQPEPTVKTLAKFLELVNEDKMCCFWG